MKPTYNMLSQLDRQTLRKQLSILPPYLEKWGRDEFTRLLALLKLQPAVEKELVEQFNAQSSTRSLPELLDRLAGSTSELTYFPVHKLKTAVNLINNSVEEESMQMSIINRSPGEFSDELNISEQVVLHLLGFIGRQDETGVIELSTQQIANLLNGCGMEEHAVIAKKYNIDGFTLICSLTDLEIIRDIRNYYRVEEIKKMMEMSCIFLALYYRQIVDSQAKNSKKAQTEKNEVLPQSPKDEVQLFECIISSQHAVKKNSEDDIEIDQAELESAYGESTFGNSQVAESDYEVGNSVRGSVYAESVMYTGSVRGSVDCRLSARGAAYDARASSMYNSEIISELRDCCLKVPFDLLNLQPLHYIKIRALKNQSQKESECWTFSLQGAKLGREKLNDIRFPDQYSISSRHAQILFKNEAFYLQDCGSKTGTFLKITKPLKIQEVCYIQLTNEVEITLRIIQKIAAQGIIKVEITKPSNLPDYRISLREGFKIKIGRSDQANIKINSSSIAEKHAEIYYKESCFYFKNCHQSLASWQKLSPKSVRSELFKLKAGDVFRLSWKKSFLVDEIYNYFAPTQQNHSQIL